MIAISIPILIAIAIAMSGDEMLSDRELGLQHANFEVRDFGLVRGCSDGTSKNLSGAARVDDFINPQSRRCIPWVHRSLIPSLDLPEALRLFLFGNVFTPILELDREQRPAPAYGLW